MTNEQRAVFLEDLTALSLKHGIAIAIAIAINVDGWVAERLDLYSISETGEYLDDGSTFSWVDK